MPSTLTDADIDRHDAAGAGAPQTLSDADIDAHDQKPEQSFGAALREYGHKMGGMVTGLNETIKHPIEATKGWIAQNEQLAQLAEDAWHKGDYTNAARHAANYLLNSLPGMGAASDEAGTKLEQGDIAGGLADTAAVASQAALGIKSPSIARGAGRLTSAAGAGIKAAAPGVASGLLKSGAGEAIGQIPGMQWPARIAFGIPAAQDIGQALKAGTGAFRQSLFPPPAPPITPQPAGMIPWPSIIQKASETEPAPLPPSVTAELTRPSEIAQPPAEAQAATQAPKPAPVVPIATRMAATARAARAGNADTLAQGLQDTGISADLADTIPRFKWRDIARAHGVDWPASSETQFNLIRDARAALRQRTTKP